MTHKDDRVYIEHMLECLDKISDYIGDDEEVFRQSTLVQDAVIRNLQIMAESSQRISQASKIKYPEYLGAKFYRHKMTTYGSKPASQ